MHLKQTYKILIFHLILISKIQSNIMINTIQMETPIKAFFK